MNVHWMVLYKILGFLFRYEIQNGDLQDLVFSENKAFEHFPIGSNVNLCPAVAAILDFQSA
jgi:hypothetical protein